MQIRKNETDRVWFRGGRCFSADGQWYIATREGVNVGPFISQKAAQRSVALYLKSLVDSNYADVFAGRVARDGIWARSNYV